MVLAMTVNANANAVAQCERAISDGSKFWKVQKQVYKPTLLEESLYSSNEL